MSSYLEVLARVRRAFPSPVANRAHDDLLTDNIAKTLQRLDAMKGSNPVLGKYTDLDYRAARQATVASHDLSCEEVSDQLIAHCQGLTMPIHPCTQRNVVPPPSMPSLLGVLVGALHNPSIGWDEYSQGIALAEVEVCAMLSHLIGYDAKHSGGMFTFGGTGTNLYGMKVGLAKALPTVGSKGITAQVAIVGSAASHYCRYSVASWLGIGADNVISASCDASNAARLDVLRTVMRRTLQKGIKIVGIIATMGTTDAFGVDDLAGIVALRDELVAEFNLPYRIHIHADAVIGWAWSVFNDYDFQHNPLAFPSSTLAMLKQTQQSMRHLHLADSVGFDFHKSGFTPIVSSAVLFKDENDISLLSRSQKQMPYLFQYGDYAPGKHTLEASRSGMGVMAAFASLRFFGKTGMQTLLAHLVDMARLTREQLATQEGVVLLNPSNVGPVTVFRLYPAGKDATRLYAEERSNEQHKEALHEHNDYNYDIFMALRAEVLAGNDGCVLSFTNCYQLTDYGEPILGLKSFIMSPFTDTDTVTLVSEKIATARKNIDNLSGNVVA